VWRLSPSPVVFDISDSVGQWKCERYETTTAGGREPIDIGSDGSLLTPLPCTAADCVDAYALCQPRRFGRGVGIGF